ncbi:bifunctional helix-turn-helix transcriptional regulator/GNAT family N-acetyltransferase [Nocardioides insulae]|uniref:bifunctional helix-turn-helix transcriptional regulator/GNAT family N-acetyltransferase n=1 Tax=Nocardioides insulae TaxID=394734 RepID=UPI0004208874|nr:bifunctional helix-turn-helix transcriptional regulator/GNAT family N-acetyltransferase [Nocardioides insulae]
MDAQTSVLRRFNRSYTQRIGALDDSFLGLGMPLTSLRLLYEIGAGVPSVQDLRTLLGLDSGFLSRTIRGLERRGYVALRPDPEDRRRRLIELTPEGRDVWNEVEQRSELRAHDLLAPLTARQRARLTEALATADLLVRAATVELHVVDPASPLARDVVRRYVAELDRRFEGGFDPGPPDPAEDALLRAPSGAFVVATSDGAAVAGGGVREDDGVAEIKRMWAHPEWRGAGLGARVLRRLEDEARALGHDSVRLDTQESLTEAIALYERAGYTAVERYNDNPYATHFFQKRLDAGDDR